MFKVLLTSTSFQDSPGAHHSLLNQQGYHVETRRGPLKESEIMEVIDQYDAVLCGDDELTRRVLEKGKQGRLKVVSKYGVGLDKIDIKAAKDLNIPVMNCPGVNQVSVAEHVFALLLTYFRNVHLEYNYFKKGKWNRMTGTELHGKTIGIIGLGAIGKEVAKRARCFGMHVLVYDTIPDLSFIKENELVSMADLKELFIYSDIISLHIPLTPLTAEIINKTVINEQLKRGVVLVNTSRGKLVNLNDLINGLTNGIVGGYLADVLDVEPMPLNYPLVYLENVIVTPHIGSRTTESIEKQGVLSVKNLLYMLNNT